MMTNNINVDEYNDGIEAKALNLKSLLVGLIAIAIFIGIIAGVMFLNGIIFGQADTGEGTRSSHPVVYVKDNALMALPAHKKTPYKVSDKYDEASVQISENGTKLFYTADGMLFSKKVNSKKKAPKEIAKVSDFKISENGKYILYTLDKALYSSNCDDVISKGVNDYFVLSEIDKVLFETDKGVYIYDYKGNNGPVELALGIGFENIVSNFEEYRKLYYIKDNSLYYKPYKKEAVLLGKGIESATLVGKTLYAEGKDTLYAVKNKKLVPVLEKLDKTFYPDSDKYMIACTDTDVFYVKKQKAVKTDIDTDLLNDVAFCENGKYMYTLEGKDIYKYKMTSKSPKEIATILFNAKDIECFENILIIKGMDDGYFCHSKNKNIMLCENETEYKYKDGMLYFLDGKTLKSLNTKVSSEPEQIATNVNFFDVKSKNHLVYGTNADINSNFALYLKKGVFDLKVDDEVSHSEIYERELEWSEKSAS